MKPMHLCTATLGMLLFGGACGDTSMQGRSYVVADSATRKAQALWVNQRPITSPFPVEIDPIEDRVETKVNGKVERVWGEGGQALKVSLRESSMSERGVLSLERFFIGRDVRPDAVLVDAEPSVTAALVQSLSETNVTPLGFGNAVQLEGPDMLMRSAWATIPNDAELAFSFVELPKPEREPASVSQPQPTHEAFSDRAQKLVHWVGLHSQGDNIVRVDASGEIQVLDQNGCLLDTGWQRDLVFQANNALLFRGRPLAKFNADLER